MKLWYLATQNHTLPRCLIFGVNWRTLSVTFPSTELLSWLPSEVFIIMMIIIVIISFSKVFKLVHWAAFAAPFWWFYLGDYHHDDFFVSPQKSCPQFFLRWWWRFLWKWGCTFWQGSLMWPAVREINLGFMLICIINSWPFSHFLILLVYSSI